jgi:hypothetical protein
MSPDSQRGFRLGVPPVGEDAHTHALDAAGPASSVGLDSELQHAPADGIGAEVETEPVGHDIAFMDSGIS